LKTFVINIWTLISDCTHPRPPKSSNRIWMRADHTSQKPSRRYLAKSNLK
jgi:hypothetical protein